MAKKVKCRMKSIKEISSIHSDDTVGPEMLRHWIASSGKNQSYVARYCDVARQTVASWLSGKRSPGVVNLIKLATMTDGFLNAKLWFSMKSQSEMDFHFKTLQKRDIDLL